METTITTTEQELINALYTDLQTISKEDGVEHAEELRHLHNDYPTLPTSTINRMIDERLQQLED